MIYSKAKAYAISGTILVISQMAVAQPVKDITGGTATLPTMDISNAIGNKNYNEALIKLKQSQNMEMAAQIAKKIEAGQASQAEVLDSMDFPVQTESMHLNAAATTKHQPTQATRPIAVIGSDTYSVNWLTTNISEIERLGAMIVIVEVSDLASFNKIKNHIPNRIKVLPLDGYPLTETFGVTEYPALITSKGIYH